MLSSGHCLIVGYGCSGVTVENNFVKFKYTFKDKQVMYKGRRNVYLTGTNGFILIT